MNRVQYLNYGGPEAILHLNPTISNKGQRIRLAIELRIVRFP